MDKVFLLLGSNQDDSLRLLLQASNLLQQFDLQIITKSSIVESEPWGFVAEQNFLNQVLQVRTSLPPQDLLQKIQQVENELGRVRSENSGYTSRTMDIDILFYGSEIVNTPTLTIPHPRLHLRRFTLVPMAEVASNFVHPILKKTMTSLLEECEDKSGVNVLHQSSCLFS